MDNNILSLQSSANDIKDQKLTFHHQREQSKYCMFESDPAYQTLKKDIDLMRKKINDLEVSLCKKYLLYFYKL